MTMTIPKEYQLPTYAFPESMQHSVQFARELIDAMQGKDILLHNGTDIRLPPDCVNGGAFVQSTESMAFPVSNRVLSNIVSGSYSGLYDKEDIERVFDFNIDVRSDSKRIDVHLGNETIQLSMEQSYVNYSEPTYQRMIFGILACLSYSDKKIIETIRNNGILITTGERATETSFWVPGSTMEASNFPRLPWQSQYQQNLLYPIDLWKESYAIWEERGDTHIKTGVQRLLSGVNPMGVMIQSDLPADIH